MNEQILNDYLFQRQVLQAVWDVWTKGANLTSTVELVKQALQLPSYEDQRNRTPKAQTQSAELSYQTPSGQYGNN